MTEKLYFNDPYIWEAESKIIEVINKEGRIEVILDKTPFYPEGGGQPSDKGTISGIPVTYVYESEDKIYHVMEEIPQGEEAVCIVDGKRRLDNMQQHSGEHLLSGAFFKLYGGVNKGFHLGEDYVTIDIELKNIDEDMVKRVEEEVNNYIYKNVETNTFFTNKSEAKKFPMRKELNLDGEIRIVKMGELDCCACCGTHVIKTGEIGLVKIIKVEKNKGMTRVYFKCGKRAFDDFDKKQKVITELNKILSTGEEEIITRVNSQREEILELKAQLLEYKRQEALKESEEIMKNLKGKFVHKILLDRNFEFIDNVYNYLKDKEVIVLLGSGVDNQIILAHNGSFSLECGKVFKEYLKDFNGKGGGNNTRAQGKFGNTMDLEKFSERIISIISEKI